MTVAVLIDLEKAYDSVWRDGLLFKLYEKEIQGKMWFWLRDFLSERTAVHSGIKKVFNFKLILVYPRGQYCPLCCLIYTLQTFMSL